MLFTMIIKEQEKTETLEAWTTEDIFEEMKAIRKRFNTELYPIGLIHNVGSDVQITCEDEVIMGMLYDYMSNGVIDEKNIDTNF